uniref:non-specific serine/threonine protein kinase n=1 Tax=Leersia perrieri TaxID=77586 RepID=A0A0D9XLU5_9ORYZ
MATRWKPPPPPPSARHVVAKSPPRRQLPHPPPQRHPPSPPPPPPRHEIHREHKQQGTAAATSGWSVGYINARLSQRTPVLGLRAWVLVAAGAAAAVLVALLVIICICRRCRRRGRKIPRLAPISHHGRSMRSLKQHQAQPRQSMSDKDIEEAVRSWHPPPPAQQFVTASYQPPIEVIKAEQKKPLIVVESARTSGETATSSGESACDWSSENGGGGSDAEPEVSRRGWGRRYTRRELEEATNGLAAENVIGEGGYGVVYKGVLRDHTAVAIKNLHNNRGQAEKDFKVEVATIGRVRHKNLVSLLGYCSEGACRMLVYEYMENSNLDKWLHHGDDEISPLTWDIRMHILLGTARGLAYLHEGLEPKIVHRDVKSSNILLDPYWNARVSDFGLAKILCSERSYVTTRVMGTFGYVAPEYARTGMLNERSDVYSFGVLIMEIITGRSPVDYTRPTAEVNLVEWLKHMVTERRVEEVVDPRLPDMPPSKLLKRAVLAALRCVDPDGSQRPTMGHIVSMLEDDLKFRDELQLARDLSPHASDSFERGEL